MAAPNEPNIVYFRRRKAHVEPILVYVNSHKESYCTPFSGLDEALDFIEEQEQDASIVCHLFQQIPLDEAFED